MTIAALLWPRARADCSYRAALGRLSYFASLVIGAFPLTIELIYHRYWPHVLIFIAAWVFMSAFGRLTRLVLARE